jgi:HEAT repeat protein
LGRALLAEPDERVRRAMFTSLSRLGTPASVQAVIPHLRSDDAYLRTGALDALRVMAPHALDHLPNLLHDDDADVRLLACEIARALPGGEATRLLCELIETERDPNVCAGAIDVLAEVGDPDALPALAQCGRRFPEHPFLSFAVKVATNRIGSQGPEQRG